MAWYSVPKVKLRILKEEDSKKSGVLLEYFDFEMLINKLEDFLDMEAVERVKKEGGRRYSFEEVKEMLASRDR